MKMKRGIGALLVAATASVMAGPALANSTFMNINFNGDTVGTAPATNTSTALPITQPYAIGGYDPYPDPNNGAYSSPPSASDGTIKVGAASGISQGAVFATNSGDNQIGALWMDTEYSAQGNALKLSFDLNVLSGTTATGQTGTLTTDSSTVDTLFGVNTFSSGDPLRFNAVATSATGGIYGIRTSNGSGGYLVTPFFSYRNGDAHNIELDANYLTGKLDVQVDGVTQLSNFAFSGSSTPNATIAETFFYLNGDVNAGSSNSVALDNVRGAIVPLPASVWSGLVLLCGLGLFGGVKRLRRQPA